MSTATTANVVTAAQIPDNKVKRFTPSLVAVYAILIVLAFVWLLPVI